MHSPTSTQLNLEYWNHHLTFQQPIPKIPLSDTYLDYGPCYYHDVSALAANGPQQQRQRHAPLRPLKFFVPIGDKLADIPTLSAKDNKGKAEEIQNGPFVQQMNA